MSIVCDTGFINIVDPFLNPDSTVWTGSITYTLQYATTVSGATLVQARQVINVSDGIDICLAPGMYTVVYNQSGQRLSITSQWTVPPIGGPYTIADLEGVVPVTGSLTVTGPFSALGTVTMTSLINAAARPYVATNSVGLLSTGNLALIAISGSASDLASGTVPAARGGAGTLTGILKANGAGVVSAAVAGTDYLVATNGTNAQFLTSNGAGSFGTAVSSTGTGSVVLATSPTLITPDLGTPSVLVLTNATGLPATAMPGLTGDVTSLAGSVATTVVKINGTTLAMLATGILKNTTATGVPSIAIAGTDYAVATNGTLGQVLTSNAAGGFSTALTLATVATSGSASDLTAGTLPAARLPALTGDATSSVNSAATTVVKINGTALSGLATGLLKNTTATGVPSIAVAGTDYAVATNGTIGQALTSNGTGGFDTAVTLATVATSGSASDLSSGTLAAARGGAGTLTGILKANGSGVVSAATAGTDYAVATNGTIGQALTSNGTGGFDTALTLATIATSGSASDLASGTVAAARGGAGTLTGILKANGAGVVSAATAGTDYAVATNGTNGQALTSNGTGGFGTAVTLATVATSGSASDLNAGTLAAARMPAITGDVTTTVGTVASTVVKINGTTLSGLATGLLKNTTTTGVPSIAVAGTDYSVATNGTIGQALTSNGTGGFGTAVTLATVATSGSASDLSSGTLAAARGGAGTLSGLLKANGAGVVSAAVAATDYAVATNGTNAQFLTSNGAGGFGTAVSSTGSGSVVLATSPTLTTPDLGTPSVLVLTNATGLPAAAMPGLTGDVTSLAGSVATTVVKINGTTLSGLATGLLKNTTTTGVPSIAVAGTDYAVATNGTLGQVLTSDAAGGFSTALTLATVATSGSASDLTSGTLAAARGGAGTLTGILKANGAGVVSAATAGTDYSVATNGTIGQALTSNGTGGFSTALTLAPVATSGSASDLGSGTLSAARLPALTGDATSSVGSAATTVVKINGTALSGLATGLLKNTTTTGVPSIAVAGTDYAVATNGTVGQALTSDGTGGFSTALTLATVATSGSASDLTAGTLAAARGGAGTLSGLLKANGAGVVSAATSGTDYAVATNGTLGQVLTSDAAGGFSTALTLATVATSGSASDLGSGTLAAARMPAITGDVTTTVGTVAATVVKINGTTLSGLATGLLKNTTATGVPSIAVAGTDYSVATNGTNGQALTSNGTGGFGTAVTLAAVATSGSASDLTAGTLAAARGGAGTLTGILKANGAGVVSAAASGTDYAVATNGTIGQALTSNGTGGFSTAVTLATVATSGSASDLNAGTLAAARMPAITGDVTTTVGTVAATVVKINGTTLSGLATGILKNTTATGVPSIAVAGTDLIGGVGNLTTVGAVPYVSATGTLNQDAADFFWDATNNRLGIGTASPNSRLTVAGTGNQIDLNATSGAAGMSFQAAGTNKWQLYNDGSNRFGLYDYTAAATRLLIDTSGNVGIGTATPLAKLHVLGTAGISGATTDAFPTSLASGIGGQFYVTHGAGNFGLVVARATNDTGSANFTFYHTKSTDPSVKSALASGDSIGSIIFQGPVDSSNVIQGGGIKGLLDAAPTAGTAGTGILPTAITFQTQNAAVGAAERMRIDSAGNVGIGTTTPAYLLSVNTDSAGKPGVGGLWTVVSDERIKTDITPADLDRCYEIVKSVPLRHFGFAPGVYTDDQIQDKHSLGWIAQDVQKVFSKAVSVKPFTLNTEIPDGTEEYTEQDFKLETVEKTETSIEIIDGKPVQVSKVVTSENKVLLFDSVDVVNEAGVLVMDGDKPLTYQIPRMVTKTRAKVRHDVIEDCLDLNGGQMIAALYGAVQSLMQKVETLNSNLAAAESAAGTVVVKATT